MANVQSTETKRAAAAATQFFLPVGQSVIAIGAIMVAIGLIINGRIAAEKEQAGEPIPPREQI